ncbi:unnamed protein product [Ceratitis capitata]|uniref:(Mediterranean fruit fly) hypothetical protein n=1 Tax=Ceratitis capitata TaxID=7213 RepID=A0A811V287_CERCA|nr:unnamed protein product [Ceratitis capitata]
MQNSTLSNASSSGSGSGSGTGTASVSASVGPSVGNVSSANSAADGVGGGGNTVGNTGDSLINVSSSANSSTSTSNGHDTKHNGFTGTSDGGTVDAQNNHDQAIVPAVNHNFHLDKSNQEIIRLIGQYLQDIGLEKSVKALMGESGCYLEHPAASKFREHVLSGEWNKADADLKIPQLNPNSSSFADTVKEKTKSQTTQQQNIVSENTSDLENINENSENEIHNIENNKAIVNNNSTTNTLINAQTTNAVDGSVPNGTSVSDFISQLQFIPSDFVPQISNFLSTSSSVPNPTMDTQNLMP